MIVAKIMTKKVHTIASNTTLKSAQKIIAQVKYHHLPVVDGTMLVGMISDRDIYRLSSPYAGTAQEDDRDEDLLYTPVSEFMSRNVISISPDTLIDTAAIMLLEHNISCLPIISTKEVLEGIITWKDLLKYYTYLTEVSELKIAR